MTVHSLLNSLHSYELAEWMAFFELERERKTPKKPKASEVLRAQFAHLVKKKG